MKISRKHLYVFFLISAVFVANANIKEVGLGNQEQEQDGRNKSGQSILRPDGNASSSQESESNIETSYLEDDINNITEVSEFETLTDSVDDDSVSKYNFIFYFLYKFKYDSEESP